MKSKTRKVLLGAATLAAVAAMDNDARAATTALPMTAKIIAAVAITQTQALAFGSLTNGGGAGTVTVNGPASTRAAGGAVKLVGGTTAQEGQFKMKGATGVNINVTFPDTDTVTNGVKQMDVTGFTVDGVVAKGGTPAVLTLTAATVIDFQVGAVLNVTATATTGNYTGSVTITANYQ